MTATAKSGGPAIDRARRFELPRIDQLTKDQEDVLALPLEGRHLVVGGPGTGKSVVAVLRARRCARRGVPYVFLVFNRLLERASRQLAGGGLESRTWISWFGETFRKLLGFDCPLIDSDGPFREIDWEKAGEMVGAHNPAPQPEQIIIDEGQDMPPDFYQCIRELGFANVFVAADQNQQIVSGRNSSRAEIEGRLGIDPDATLELRENWRNPYPVARLARHFHTGDPASPPPELPPKSRRAATPLLFAYRPDQFDGLIRRILLRADRDVRKLIGVIAPNNKVRERYFRALGRVEAAFDHGRPPVRTYASGARDDLDFTCGGVMVINAQSCKGLEFDEVFLADINEFRGPGNDPDEIRRRFYVMVARSRGMVAMLREAGQPCEAAEILPPETETLERYGKENEN